MAEWKPFDLTWGRSIYYCTECEESTEVPTVMGKPIYKYCPMCGAKMNADRKTEPLDKDINVRSKTEPQWTKENCKGCKYNEYPYDSGTCFVRVCINGNKYEPKDEPQTAECPFDDAIPCEWACTEYGKCKYKTEPQTEVDWKQRLCDMYGADRKSFDEAWKKYEADKVEDEPQTDRSE